MTSNLSAQLNTLSESLKGIDSLISRLSALTFHPGSESLTGEISARTELAQDIHESLKQLEEELELLKQEAEDLTSTNYTTSASLRGRRESVNDRDRDRVRLNAHIARIGEDLRSSRAHFRRAQLNAKKASELAKQKEREAVFASLQNPPPAHPSPDQEQDRTNDLFSARRPGKSTTQPKSQEQREVDASASVTAALRRTHNLLSTELSRSRFAQETFDQSTAALAELGEKYSNLDSLLKGSRELLGTLLRSQKSDTWYLETAFYILITTLVWLVFRRILLGPFVRLPLFVVKLFWRPVVWVLYLTGIITTDTVSSATTTVATALSSTRTPLIVQPSAASRGDIPRFDEEIAEQMRQHGGVPVGAGGSHAKQGGDQQDGEHTRDEEGTVLRGEMSERIARMAQERVEKEDEVVRRGDGKVLEERGDVLPNPKKRMFEADVEDARFEQQQQQQAGQQGQRDEL